jgi:divalent metal cation (Fe/Co/Zn/Cd) transporter
MNPDEPHCGCGARSAAIPRESLLRRALRLEYLTVAWNVVEGVVAVTAALLTGSVALLGFGVDSFVESGSALVLVWRLRVEHAGRLGPDRIEALEHRASRLVGFSLFLLGGYVALDAAWTLWRGNRPEFSLVGVVLTAISLAVMLWLARAKRRAARALGSRALESDAFQTTACWWLSLSTLVGVGLNGALGWWWADPAAALVVAALVVREGREAWAGERDCC